VVGHLDVGLMADGWRYLLGNSADLTNLGELTSATSRTLKYDDNGSGDAACTITIDDDLAEYVKPWKTCLIAQCNDVWRWTGPITACPVDGASRKMSISAVGWFEKISGAARSRQ
jgi:hypothetical protein